MAEIIVVVCKDKRVARAVLRSLRRGLRLTEAKVRQGVGVIKTSPTIPDTGIVLTDSDGNPMTIEDLDAAIDLELKRRKK